MNREDLIRLADRYLTCVYCKYPKNSYTKVSDKMAYASSTDPDQTDPAIPLQLHKKQNLGQKGNLKF